MFNQKDSNKLGNFISEVKNKGLARNNRYSVKIYSPAALRLYSPNDVSTFNLMCDSVQLPGMSYSTNPNRTYGESREVPYERLFDNITLSFYVDTDMKIKEFFDDWQRNIMDPTTRMFNYYNEYISEMDITVDNLEDKEIYAIKLYECYPKTIGQIQLDYAAKDIMKLSVTFAYKYWNSLNNYNKPTDLLNGVHYATNPTSYISPDGVVHLK